MRSSWNADRADFLITSGVWNMTSIQELFITGDHSRPVNRAGKDRFQAIHQEVVKMEIIPDQSTDLYGPSSTEDIAEITKPVATMELQIGQAVLRISNQTDPRLLEQTLKLIGAFSC